MDYVFNQKDLQKAIIECDDIAVTVLWNETKKELQASTRLATSPQNDDEIVAVDQDKVVPLYTFGYGALMSVGTDFKNQAELCAALNREYENLITTRKAQALKAA